MSEPTILPVKPGTLNEQDRATLREVGVVVIECENPREIRLLRPACELDSSALVRAALKALSPISDDKYKDATKNREVFCRLLAESLDEVTQPPATSAPTKDTGGDE